MHCAVVSRKERALFECSYDACVTCSGTTAFTFACVLVGLAMAVGLVRGDRLTVVLSASLIRNYAAKCRLTWWLTSVGDTCGVLTTVYTATRTNVFVSNCVVLADVV